MVLSVITAITFFLMPAPTVLYNAELVPIVTLPAGYFVMLSDETPPDGYISVVYDDISGLVRRDSVQAVDYRPVTKYETTVTFTCDNDGQKVNLRVAPSKTSDIITVMPSDAFGHCYGSITGDALIAGGDDVWHYVSYGDMRGYCYYAHVSVSPTPPNIIEKEPDPVTEPTTGEPVTEPEQPKSTVTSIIFIVALCLPVPFIMFYLFRKPKERD